MGAIPGHSGGVFDDAEETSPAESLVGREFGNYRLLQLLGEGGMGWIYLAHHLRIGRRVAIKMLRPELASDPVVLRRFFAEARAVNRINHENIVEIHDFVHNEHGYTYLVLEFLVGRDLLTLIETDSGVPLGRALDIMAQVARALGAAHDAGVVHRDLKPENIFLTDAADGGDFVKLLDFGIAKLLCAGSSPRLTRAGTAVGTPNYISPEQALGAEVDHRADIYSFGLILYELATGRRPFASADVVETVAKQVTEVPTRPLDLDGSRDIPPALDVLIMQCVAKRAAERPQTMEEIESRLRTIRAVLDGAPLDEPASAIDRGPSLADVSFGDLALPRLTAVGTLAARRLALGAAALMAIGLGWITLARGIEHEEPAAHASAPSPDDAQQPAPDHAPAAGLARRLHGPPLSAAPRRSPHRRRAPATASAAPTPAPAPSVASPVSAARPGRYDIIPVY
ncbi:MAG TPA: serine/threonine-protein kinase [Kofleriaceae bacterium]